MLRYIALVLICLGLFTGCGHHLYHRVESGDTLYSISWQYGYDYKTVARWNGIDKPYRLAPGQVVHLAPQQEEVDRKLFAKTYEVISIEGQPVPSVPQSAAADRTKHIDSKTRESTVVRPTKNIPSQNHVVEKAEPYVQPRISGSLNWRWPTEGKVIADFKSSSSKLKGLDIAGRMGQAIRAAAPGKVVYSGNALKGYGNLVIIKHDERYLSAYAHNRDIFVQEGDMVGVGQKIAEMGNSDRDEVALHFEIRQEGKPVDPYLFLQKRK